MLNLLKMKLLTTILLFVSSFITYSQVQIKLNTSDESVKKSALEVYKETEQYLQKQHLQFYKELIERVEIIEVSKAEIEKGNYPLISTLSLVSKYNSDLDYDKGPNFNILNFNPLKYFWITEKDGSSKYYRIYGENYLIRLLPNL